MKAACDALLEQLKEGATLAPELDTHLRGCAACQAAQKAFDFSWGPESPPSEVALRQLRAASLTELQRSPVAHPWAQDAWTAVGISIAAAAGALALLGRQGIIHNPQPRPLLLGTELLLFLTACVAGAAAFHPSRGKVWPWLLPVALGAALTVVFGGAGDSYGTALLPAALGCGALAVGVSLLPFLVTLGLSTGFAARPWQMVSGGIAAGMAGALVLHLHCPVSSSGHLLLGHLLPSLLLGLLAASVRGGLPSRTFAP